MTSSVSVTAGCHPRGTTRSLCSGFVAVFVPILLSACASGSLISDSRIERLTPLQLDGQEVRVSDVSSRVETADLLSVNSQMQEFVTLYTAGLSTKRMKLMSLHAAVSGSGGLDISYEPFAEGSAIEVFSRRSANCLSYASLFIALAREAGLQANYQWIDVRPQWSRVNQRAQVGLHVNVVVRLRGGKQFMVDIDPLPAHDFSGSEILTDEQGEALFYNNLAMSALAEDDLEKAWLHVVKSLQLHPDNPHFWANLGAVYRAAGQYDAAEESYLTSLDLDFNERTAMTNLAILYGLQGRTKEEEYWLARAEAHRRSNPYYHAWLGDEAAAEGDLDAAIDHYETAISIGPNDANLHYSQGILYYQQSDYEASVESIEEAIQRATRRSDISYYQSQLKVVRDALSQVEDV